VRRVLLGEQDASSQGSRVYLDVLVGGGLAGEKIAGRRLRRRQQRGAPGGRTQAGGLGSVRQCRLVSAVPSGGREPWSLGGEGARRGDRGRAGLGVRALKSRGQAWYQRRARV